MAWKVKEIADGWRGYKAGWYVVSGKGNPQSGPYPTKAAAEHYLPENVSEKSKSVRAVSGRLPTLGKHRR
jgi:hypothetical protein